MSAFIYMSSDCIHVTTAETAAPFVLARGRGPQLSYIQTPPNCPQALFGVCEIVQHRLESRFNPVCLLLKRLKTFCSSNLSPLVSLSLYWFRVGGTQLYSCINVWGCVLLVSLFRATLPLFFLDFISPVHVVQMGFLPAFVLLSLFVSLYKLIPKSDGASEREKIASIAGFVSFRVSVFS